jgi:hypothetical protein
MPIIRMPQQPQRSAADRRAAELRKVLPAPTVAEIADRLSARLGWTVMVPTAAMLIYHVRRNNERLGWTIPHVKRGINETGADRFFAVLNARDGTVIDPDQRLAHDQGAHATFQSHATQCEHMEASLLATANHSPGRNDPRWLRSVAMEARHFAEKLHEIADNFDEENGTV